VFVVCRVPCAGFRIPTSTPLILPYVEVRDRTGGMLALRLREGCVDLMMWRSGGACCTNARCLLPPPLLRIRRRRNVNVGILALLLRVEWASWRGFATVSVGPQGRSRKGGARPRRLSGRDRDGCRLIRCWWLGWDRRRGHENTSVRGGVEHWIEGRIRVDS
jgi:hypothetical protein